MLFNFIENLTCVFSGGRLNILAFLYAISLNQFKRKTDMPRIVKMLLAKPTNLMLAFMVIIMLALVLVRSTGL